MPESKHYYVNLQESFTDIHYRLTDEVPQSLGYHHHMGFELMQMWNDAGTVLMGDSILPMKRGALYLIDASTAHCTNPSTSEPYVRSKITFAPSMLMPLLEATESMHLLRLFTDRQSDMIIELDDDTADLFDRSFERLCLEYDQKKSGYHTIMVSTLLTMLTEIDRLKPHAQAETTDHIHPLVLSIMDYVNQNLTSDFSIDDLTDHLHFSKYYLCHTFKKHTGVTIVQYMIDRKIAHAKHLLTHSKKTVSQIAITSGFNGITQFSRTFTRITGISPLKYRKANTPH